MWLLSCLVTLAQGWFQEFGSRCPTALGLAVSAVIFLGGYQDFKGGDRNTARAWWVIAMLILCGFAVSAVVFGRWLSLVLCVGGLVVEFKLIGRWDPRRSQEQ